MAAAAAASRSESKVNRRSLLDSVQKAKQKEREREEEERKQKQSDLETQQMLQASFVDDGNENEGSASP